MIKKMYVNSIKQVVLFTQVGSIYQKLDCDCYDITRDALTYSGNQAVIAHPPCRLFSRLRGLSSAPISEKDLAFFAVDYIRKNGGVLEHPAQSTLFGTVLPLPNNTDEYGGYTIQINQHDFGHRARKKTWLYFVGIPKLELPIMPLNFDAITHSVSCSKINKKLGNRLKELSKKGACQTPVMFAKWLIEVCRLIELNKNQK